MHACHNEDACMPQRSLIISTCVDCWSAAHSCVQYVIFLRLSAEEGLQINVQIWCPWWKIDMCMTTPLITKQGHRHWGGGGGASGPSKIICKLAIICKVWEGSNDLYNNRPWLISPTKRHTSKNWEINNFVSRLFVSQLCYIVDYLFIVSNTTFLSISTDVVDFTPVHRDQR
jgi:hypothetical protein